MIIDNKLMKAAAFAATGAGLTFFGLIHSESIGIGKTPGVAAAYLLVAGFLALCSLKRSMTDEEPVEPMAHAVAAE
jgi:AGZA family xanthine/uracil permease-like MFS transporter